jgi:pimeloyl-ACP methyl ester carboxylesterase
MKTVLQIIAAIAVVLTLLVGGFIVATWAPELSVAELQGRWAPPPSVFVDVLGMKVHLRDEGPRDDKSPIVLMHGMGSSLHAWDGWAEALRGERRVIRFDLAGFGLTGPSPDGIYGGENDMRLLIAVLDKLGVERCVLGGNSLGGSVSLRTALEHPSRVEKLIIVDGGGYQSAPASQPIGFHLLRIPGVGWLLQNTLPRFLVEQGFRNVFGDPRRVTAEMVDRSVALTRREGNRHAIVERFRQRRPGTLADRIPQLKLPTLIVWGGRDRLIPVEVAHRLHRDIAGSTLAIFDDLGHAPEEEDPARTVEAVKQFLQLRSATR